MRVLMISNDPSILSDELGDVVARHQAYGKAVDILDIIILTKKGYENKFLAANVQVKPTNSRVRTRYARDAVKIGRKLIKTVKYDLVVTQDPFLTAQAGYFLAKKCKAAFLVHLHGDFLFNKYLRYEGWAVRLLHWLAKRMVRKADAVRVVSQGVKNKVIKARVPAERIRVIHTAVDMEKFSQVIQAKSLEMEERYQGQRVILYVGRLEPIKGLRMLVKTFAKVAAASPQAHLVIVGNGSQYTSLRSRFESIRLSHRVDFVGQIDHKELAAYYQVASAVVLTSFSESFGKVIIEAAGAGTPTVSTATTGALGLIDNGKTGYLVNIKDYKAASEYLLTLIKDSNLSARLGAAAYSKLQVLPSWEENIKQVVTYWNDIVRSKKVKKS